MKSRKSTETRKEEIVRAALVIIERKGLDTLNINDIAEEIQLVPSAIYRHFKGKEEIVESLIEYADKSLKHNLSQASAFDGRVIEKLKVLFELHVKLLIEEAAIPRILYFTLNSDRNSKLKETMLSSIDFYVQQVKALLIQGQEKGEIRLNLDIEAAAVLFLGMVQPLAILSQIKKEVLNECPNRIWDIYQHSIEV